MNKFLIILLIILITVVGIDFSRGTTSAPATAKPTEKLPSTPSPTSSPIDVARPSLLDIRVLVTEDFRYSITWQTDKNSTSTIRYWVSDKNSAISVSNPGMLTAHSVDLGLLTPDTTINFEVESIDATGNKAISTFQSFRTHKANPPVISNVIVSDIVIDSVTVVWQTDRPTKCQLKYKPVINLDAGSANDVGCINQCSKKYPNQILSRDQCAKKCTEAIRSGDYLTINEDTYKTDHSLRLTDITATQKYIFTIQAEDNYGSKSSYDNSFNKTRN